MESQPNNPLHGIKLEQIIMDLVGITGGNIWVTQLIFVASHTILQLNQV